MKIRKIRIGNFGKLTDFEVSLEDGVNIIYGGNEAGKSTLQGFILACLYGSSLNRKSGKESLRKRFIPFDKNFASGVLEIESGEEEIIIEKKVAATKKDDATRVYSKASYEQLGYTENIGREILGLNDSAFLKTLFITQDGTSFSEDRDEGLILKLTNLLDTGDEEISYNKAMIRLDEEIRKTKNNRKTGRLDQLYLEQGQLNTELMEGIRTRKILETLEQELAEALQEREDLKQEAWELYALKDKIRIYQIKDEYIRLKRYADGIRELKEKSRDLFSLDMEDALQTLRQQHTELLQNREELDQKETEQAEIQREMRHLEMELESYAYFRDFDDSLLIEMIRLDTNIQLLNEKLKYFTNSSPVNEEIVKRRGELKSLLHDYEKSLMRLKPDPMKGMALPGLGVLASMIFYFVNGQNPYSLLTLILVIPLYLLGRKLRSAMRHRALRRSDQLEERIEALAREIGVDSKEVLRSKRIIETIPDNRETGALQNDLKDLMDKRVSVFTSSASDSLEHFIEKFNRNKSLRDKEKELSTRLALLGTEVSNLSAIHDAGSDAYLDMLRSLGFKGEVEHSLDFIEYYEAQLIKKRNIMIQEESLRLSFKNLIGDRDEAEVMKEIEQLEVLGFTEEVNEEELDSRIRKNSSAELLLQDRINRAEAQILEARRSKREPSIVEGELMSKAEEISDMEKRFKALQVAKEAITESYKLLRLDFGPRLNKRVSEIFNLITESGREIKVNEFFTMNYLASGFLHHEEFLSHGAFEQIYFALRLAMIEMMFGDQEVPIILDEPFVHYHKDRLEKSLDYLLTLGEHKQVILFTCHEREMEYLGERANVIRI
ncbi:MAG TPA: AAA family ATPase [Clostridiaceae bacterium]|nr:AAA family ATPase [Clostridiaceae bacterium]